jgi:hypothetical protein
MMPMSGIPVPSCIKLESSAPCSVDAAILKLKKYHPIICRHIYQEVAISPPLLLSTTMILHRTSSISTNIDPT